MEEQLISFEVAKLAKKKGYILGCNYWYNFSGLLCGKFENPHIPANGKFPSYSAPTQSLLQKWLREVHDIFVFVAYGEDGFIVQTWKKDELEEAEYPEFDSYTSQDTYEEALELGLQEALKLINL